MSPTYVEYLLTLASFLAPITALLAARKRNSRRYAPTPQGQRHSTAADFPVRITRVPGFRNKIEQFPLAQGLQGLARRRTAAAGQRSYLKGVGLFQAGQHLQATQFVGGNILRERILRLRRRG